MKHAKFAFGLLGLLGMVAGWMPEAWAETEIVDGGTWSFRFVGDTAMVTGAAPAEGKLSIPAMLGTHPVGSVGSRAFGNCDELTGIVIPDSVTNIESFAFYECTGLTGVTIGEQVKNIGSWAFAFCSGLTNVMFPDSLTRIEDDAF